MHAGFLGPRLQAAESDMEIFPCAELIVGDAFGS